MPSLCASAAGCAGNQWFMSDSGSAGSAKPSVVSSRLTAVLFQCPQVSLDLFSEPRNLMSLDCMSELSSSVDSSGSGAPSLQVFDSQSGEHPGYRCCSFMHDPRASIASLQVARLGGSDHLAGLTARSTTTVGDKLLDAAKSNDSRQFDEAQAVSVRHHCSCWERHGTRKRGHEPCRRLSSSLHGSEHTWLCSNCSNSSQVGAISAI